MTKNDLDPKQIETSIKNIMVALEKANKAGCFTLVESHQLFIDINNVNNLYKSTHNDK